MPQERVPLAGSERPRPTTHTLVAPVGANEELGIKLVVRPRPGSPPLPDLDYWQATPPGKRRFLSRQEYATTYGAAQADLDAIATFAVAHSLTVIDSHAGRR